MQHKPPKSHETGHAVIADVAKIKEQTVLQRILASQAFWVTVALALLVDLHVHACEPSFGTVDNVANITRNFAPFGIMALGMTVVIITGGIDLSVGSIMGLVAIVAGLFLTWEYPWYVAFLMGLLTGIACGAVNGFFVAYVGMPSFVVTLGMLSIARSLAVVLSGNQMLYKFGPDAPIVKAIGQAKWPVQTPGDWIPDWIPQFSSHFWVMVVMALVRRLCVQLQALGPSSLRHRRQRARRAAHRRAGRLDQVPGLRLLGLHGRRRLAAAARLQRLGDQRDGPGLRAARHRRHRHRRRQPDGRRRHGLRRGHRLGLPRGHPQRAADGGHRFQLARRLRRRLHHSRGASRHADPAANP